MRPPEAEIRRLVVEWVRKADLDYRIVLRLQSETEFRDVVAFHAQQAVEKYLKALLTRHQIEFPKTHELRRLLELLRPVVPALAASLEDVKWLEPFGVEIRYPADRPETLPGEEALARDLADKARRAVTAALELYLSGG